MIVEIINIEKLIERFARMLTNVVETIEMSVEINFNPYVY